MGMMSVSNDKAAIIRTERGLTIAGTRLSLYEIIDLLKAEYPPKLIRDKFNLTNEQINSALSYLKVNHLQVEAEYQEVLETRSEIRQYWEARNRKHLTQIATIPGKPGQEKLWAKLEEQKAKRDTEKL